jgi:hypothetical protein
VNDIERDGRRVVRITLVVCACAAVGIGGLAAVVGPAPVALPPATPAPVDDATSSPADATSSAGEATTAPETFATNCASFLQAYADGTAAPYAGYANNILEQMDMADAARGCRPAVGSATENTILRSIYRQCAEDSSQTLYPIVQSIYGEVRAIAKIGYGDGCS